jgi:hypothetical protein
MAATREDPGNRPSLRIRFQFRIDLYGVFPSCPKLNALDANSDITQKEPLPVSNQAK